MEVKEFKIKEFFFFDRDMHQGKKEWKNIFVERNIILKWKKLEIKYICENLKWLKDWIML